MSDELVIFATESIFGKVRIFVPSGVDRGATLEGKE
jgi:hypothetical protein